MLSTERLHPPRSGVVDEVRAGNSVVIVIAIMVVIVIIPIVIGVPAAPIFIPPAVAMLPAVGARFR